MLFWCMAVCAQGHGDILLEESLCGPASVEEYLKLENIPSYFPLCANAA